MNEFDFIFTDDRSVGLYNNNVNDIYHSKTGALTESFEKFIFPSFSLTNKNELNILDICYGIGYNTKSALLQKKTCSIDAAEYDKRTVILSPFINDGIDSDEIKLFLLSEILKYIEIDEIYTIVTETVKRTSIEFFREDMINLIEFLINKGYKTNQQAQKHSFLHNIYYEYISNDKKKDLETNNINKSKINYYFNDARKSIRQLNKKYDIVFLDAFSPQKDPTLWTINFLSIIKEKMNYESVLVSYSKSTPFRSALCELGFCVGKTFIDGVDMGTIASLDKTKILAPLSNYDIELLKTRSGITYKDFTLCDSADTILKRREEEQKNSNRLSHTAFLKKIL